MNASATHESSTVAAIATAAGTGAVSLIRLSGPQAREVAVRACGMNPADFSARKTRRCRVRAADGSILDDGLLTFYQAPRSYTGEHVVEFTGHGGILVTREVLQRFLECGATAAAPGEFTRRAFLNGKLDLTQAEGVMDLISAQTRLALRAAHSQLEGTLGKRITAARDQLLEALAHLEAWIDFPEEDIDPDSSQALEQRLVTAQRECSSLLDTAERGRILREGVRTVICGPPNVGKSSLLNRLLGYERAIVSELAGTTRDTIEETINLEGIPLRLIDTAGVRDTHDTIEAEGVRRAIHHIQQADLLLLVADATQPRPPTQAIPEDARCVAILNKADLAEHPCWQDSTAIRLSCHSGQGFDQLALAIRDVLHLAQVDWGEHAVAINARHQQCLLRARDSLQAALALMAPGQARPELAAIDLREALDALGEIAGKVDTEDLLGAIFARFCIGK